MITDLQKKAIRFAIKSLENCQCAGSEGYRRNLKVADQLREILGVRKENEGEP